MAASVYTDQIVGGLVHEGIKQAEQLKADRMAEIIQIAMEKEAYARTALRDALECIKNVRDFTSIPESILGRINTKHGEVAEHIEVEIRNGRDILQHIKPSATFNGVGRTAPEDYIIGDSQVQSKFINGAGKSLDHVLEHLHKYPGFTDKGYYHIPKDQYELLEKIYKGEDLSDVSSRTIRKCKDAIAQIEAETGKSFGDVVRPGLSTYKEVQFGNVDETLDGYEKEFNETSDKEISGIRKEKTENLEQAQHITDASWGEALKYSAVSAAITGATSAGIEVYKKIHGGKKITDFTVTDWKDIGYDFVKGSGKGAVSGASIYGLTKVAGMSAPFASAIVSSSMGVASVYANYRRGEITESEYADATCSLCVEAGIAAVGSAIGQAVIPVPVLGAIVGSAVAKASLEVTRLIVGKNEDAFMEEMQKSYDALITALDAECRRIIAQMDVFFSKLGGLIESALDPEVNRALQGSIELARFTGVEESLITHDIEELNANMTS